MPYAKEKPEGRKPSRKLTKTFQRAVSTSERARLRRERAAKVKTALRAFHPKSKDRQSFRFIGLDGKPLAKDSNRKGFFVYIYRSKTGRTKARIVKEPHKPIVARRQRTINLFDTRKKRALEKFYGRRLDVMRSGSLRQSKSDGSIGLNYLNAADKIANQLRRTSNLFLSHGSFVIDISFTVKDFDGRLRTFHTRVEFSQAEKQVLKGKDYKKFIRQKVYAFLANELSKHELVTKGSARHIKNLSRNRGASQDEWEDRHGDRWEKNEYEQVKLIRIDYEIQKIRR